MAKIVQISIVVLSIGIIAAGFVLYSARSSDGTEEMSITGTLKSTETSHSFGEISMSAGKVSHVFEFRNESGEPVKIGELFTSCMCTEVRIRAQSGQTRYYGMKGHGSSSKTEATILPNETAVAEVVFDPAAHGPAGVGRVEREAVVVSTSGQRLKFAFSAIVKP